MHFKEPKNNDKISWTKHSFEKMKHYSLSPQRVIRIMRHPERCEEAVAEGCVAAMQSLGQKSKTEIWMMYKEVQRNGKPHRKIITAWRYPGVSKVRDRVPIPAEIEDEISNIINQK